MVAGFVSSSLLVVGAPADAGAPCSGSRCHEGTNTGSGYTAAAAYASVKGSSPSGSRMPCRLESTGRLGHIVVHSHGPVGDNTYFVFTHCFPNSARDSSLEPEETDPPGNVIDLYVVTPGSPEELLEEALANLNVPAPVIETSPGDGNPSLVGIETYLMVDSASWGPVAQTETDGVLSVRVWAQPKDNGQVIWDTGESTVRCIGNGRPPGSCSYAYQSSSATQPAIAGIGPAFPITASISYTGGYEVFVGGQFVGGSGDLGDVTRTSDPLYLPVAEAQAINTEAGG